MKISEILIFHQNYEKLSIEKMPFFVAYKLNKIFNAFAKDKEFYEEQMNKIILEYAQVDENGLPKQNADKSGILIQEDRIQECHEKINELQNLEIDIPEVTFSPTELNSLRVSPETLQSLMPFIYE